MVRFTLMTVSLIVFSLMVPAASLKTEKGTELRNDLWEQGKGPTSTAKIVAKDRGVDYCLQCALLCVLLGAASWYLRNMQSSDIKKPVAGTKAFSMEEQVKAEPPVQLDAGDADLPDENYHVALDEYLDTQRQQNELDESDDVLDELLNVSQDTLDAEFQKIMPTPQPSNDETIAAKLEQERSHDYEMALDAYLDRQRQQDETEESDEMLKQLLKLSQDTIDAEFEAEMKVRPSSPRPCRDRVEESIEALLASELEAQLHPGSWLDGEQ